MKLEKYKLCSFQWTKITFFKINFNVCLGMYENAEDREGLRQMLSGLRRDPMEVNRV